MTPTEINRRLALAIGYAPEDVDVSGEGAGVFHGGSWILFDHQDWSTIGPIMERYAMFPHWNTQHHMWTLGKASPRGSMPMVVLNDCSRTCAALALIEAHERGLLP